MPAGSPSRMPLSPGPCDSPAVSRRSRRHASVGRRDRRQVVPRRPGSETSTQSGSSSSTAVRRRSAPAIANAIAMRWSPWVVDSRVPRRPASDAPAVGQLVRPCAPTARSPATDAAIRSDSLTRSSAASRSSHVPSAAAIATASRGSSSMSVGDLGRRRGGSARSGLPPRTWMSPTGSGRLGAAGVTSIVGAHLAQHVDDRESALG